MSVVVAAGALSLGFICSAIASFIAWLARGGGRRARWILLQWSDRDIINENLATLGLLGIWPSERSRQDEGSIDASVTTDLAYNLVRGSRRFTYAAGRMSRLLDLTNATSNSLIALALGLAAVVAAIVVTSIYQWGRSPDLERTLWFGAWMTLGTLMLWMVRDSQRRVARVCESYLRALLDAYSRSQRAAVGRRPPPLRSRRGGPRGRGRYA